jgi:hypothetical protein
MIEPHRLESGSRQQVRAEPGGRAAIVAVLVVIAFVAAVRLRVADVPLERDEGEYAYAGRLILDGVPPYRLVYNMKFPGTYYSYAAILAVFGRTAWGIHVGLLVVNAATILLVFAIGRRLLGAFPATIAAASFALLSLDRWTLGVFAHATHFVVVAALAGLLLLLRAGDSKRPWEYLGAGVLLGTAVLMKQHAIFFLPLAAGLVLWDGLRGGMKDVRGTIVRTGLLAVGSAVPLAVVVAVLFAQGVLGNFWFWTFRYSREYVTQVPLQHAAPNFVVGLRDVSEATLLLWLLGAAGLVALWAGPWSAPARRFLTALLGASSLSICPGLYFRQHYFLLLVPVVALLGGVAVASLERLLASVAPVRVARGAAILAFLAAVACYVVPERGFLFSMSPRDLSRFRYGANPFVEAPEIARYIRERTEPLDRIAVLGSEPEIYFYADRRSATGYIYAYPFMEIQDYARSMQEDMMQAVEAAHPKFLVYVSVEESWLPRPESDRTILEWASRYVRACYDLVGVADIHSMQHTTYVWEGEAAVYRPLSQNLLYTFQRKSDAPCGVRQAR